jgi:hypothetical protein
MKFNECSKVLIFTVLIFLVISCNDQSQNNDKELADTSSKDQTEIQNTPAFRYFPKCHCYITKSI